MYADKTDAGKVSTLILFVLFCLALFLLHAIVVQAVWNALLPGLFGLPRLAWWQACLLVILVQLLKGSWRLGVEHSDE